MNATDANQARPNISHVAARAGVSIKTVSRVLNESPGVRPTTRERVLTAMSELDFVANVHARLLAGHRQSLIALVVPSASDLYSFYLHDLVCGFVDAVEGAGNQALIVPDRHGAGDTDRYVRFLREGRADGLVVIVRPGNVSQVARLAKARVPIVAIDDALLDPPVTSVKIDNRTGARSAVEHLIDLGHRRIVHLAGKRDFGCTFEREFGFREAMLAAGLNEGISVIPGDYRRSTGLRLGLELLDQDQPPTAVFCANDELALGVMEAAHRRGLSVGRDLSIVGFDDTSAARAADPRLTTVHQPLGELAQRAVRLLFERLQGSERRDQSLVLPSRLIVRESSGEFRAADRAAAVGELEPTDA